MERPYNLARKFLSLESHMDPRKLLEQKKAEILETARKQAEEIDRDMVTLDSLLGKYSLKLADADAIATGVTMSTHARPAAAPRFGGAAAVSATETDIVSTQYNGSVTKASVMESEKMIREAGKPIPLGDLFDRLAAKGIKFQSKEPKSTLSAVLGQSGKLASHKGIGWWLKDEPLPKPPPPLSALLS
jgi:hypothetical protein